MSQDIISLTLEPREVTGKAVKQLRRDGRIPAVIHDHGKDSLIVQVEQLKLLKVWKQAGKHHPVQLDASGRKYTALIKDADFDPKKNTLRHVVFNAVNANEKVEAEVPIQAKYQEGNDSAPAERAGLLVLNQLESVLVEAVPSKLPDVLYYNAEKLVEVGDHASVADLVVPDGVEIKTDTNHSIATVYEPSAVAAANEALAGEGEEPGAGEEAGEQAEEGAAQAGEATEETTATDTDEEAAS